MFVFKQSIAILFANRKRKVENVIISNNIKSIANNEYTKKSVSNKYLFLILSLTVDKVLLLFLFFFFFYKP